jgi:hypothetical protein
MTISKAGWFPFARRRDITSKSMKTWPPEEKADEAP